MSKFKYEIEPVQNGFLLTVSNEKSAAVDTFLNKIPEMMDGIVNGRPVQMAEPVNEFKVVPRKLIFKSYMELEGYLRLNLTD